MAQRYEILSQAQDRAGFALQGCAVTVKDPAGVNLTVYDSEAGAGTLSNPLTTDANGRAEGWVAVADFDLHYDRGSSGALFTPYVEKVRLGETRLASVESVQTVAYGSGIDYTGASSSTTALQALVDALSTAGGGILRLGEGTLACNLVLKPRVFLVGAGIGATVLKSVASSNADVVKGLNFATLTGKAYAAGDYALGTYEAGVGNLTIDGNKANNTGGYGIRGWGRAPKFWDLEIKSCDDDGLWWEFTEVDSFLDPAQVLEGHIGGVLYIHDCGGDGMTWRGPHDTVCERYVAWDNTGWACRVEQTAGGYTGGVTFLHANSYLNGNSFYADGAFELVAGAATGETGTGIEFTATSGSGKVGPGVVVAGHVDGIILRGTNHNVEATFSNNTSDALVIDGAGWCTVRMNGNGNNNGVNVISEGGPNDVQGILDIPAAKTLKAGAAWNSRSAVMLTGNGAGGNFAEQQFADKSIVVGGWSPDFPTSDGTLLATGIENLTYGTTVNTNAALNQHFRIVATNGVAFTIANPTNAVAKEITYEILNSSGGAMGAITWGSAFMLAGAFTNPASTKRRTISFVWNGSNWVETARAAADI